MMNSILNTIRDALGLAGMVPVQVWALMLSSIFSLYGVHVLKRKVLPVAWRRAGWIRGLAIALAVLPAMVLWPHGYVRGALWGVGCGMFWSMSYRVFVVWAYRRWPWLEDKLSATPTGTFD